MRHRVAGRKLGRTSAHRLALLRNLAGALFERERIRTTLAKAKELRPFAEKLVTLSKRESLHARRRVLRHIHDRAVVAKLFDTLSARYAQRPGGYTRILRLGPRQGDAAEMALIELVGAETTISKKTETQGKGRKPKPGPVAEAETPPAEAKKPRARGKSQKAAAPKRGRKRAAETEEEKAPSKKKARAKKAAGKKAAGKRTARSSRSGSSST